MQFEEGKREAAGCKVMVVSLPKLTAAMVGIQGPWNKVIWVQNVILSAVTVPGGMTMEGATKNMFLVVTESCS